jgi:hypothetical protein
MNLAEFWARFDRVSYFEIDRTNINYDLFIHKQKGWAVPALSTRTLVLLSRSP